MSVRWFVALTLATSISLACVRRAPLQAARGVDPDGVTALAPVDEDSVRGVVRVVGPAPGNLTLRPATGGAIDLMGEDLAAIRTADGLEVALFGQFGPPSGVTTSATGFVITRFAVRAVDGDAAIDGVLERGDDGFTLRLFDGARIPLAAVPDPLRASVGMRVFWAGPLGSAPRAYGILGPARAGP